MVAGDSALADKPFFGHRRAVEDSGMITGVGFFLKSTAFRPIPGRLRCRIGHPNESPGPARSGRYRGEHGFNEGMGGKKRHEDNRVRSLRVTRREAVTLLSALELSPFDDEILTQKLLTLVYSQAPAHDRPPRPVRDFKHHRTYD